MRFSHVTSVALLLAFAGCESSPLETSAAPGDLRATVSGATSSDYQGSGQFRTAPAGLPRPLPFALWSEGVGSAANEGFQFNSEIAPAAGTYALGTDGTDGPAVRAIYSRQSGTKTERFAARSGSIEITLSTPHRIEGTFRFTGVLASTCASVGSSYQCSVETVGDGPTIDVAGSFAAVPYTGGGAVR